MADEVVSIMDEFVHALNPSKYVYHRNPKRALFTERKNPKP
jgi:hypothetical protein